MTTKVPAELSSTPSIVDNGNATAITIDSSESVGVNYTTPSSMNASANNLVVGSGASSDNTGITIFSNSNASSSIHFADGTSGAAAYAGYIYYTHSGDLMGFGTGGTLRMRLDSDGLKFGSNTAASNALDDYEEGTWTPATYLGTLTVASGTAIYRKIGGLVVASCRVSDFSNTSSSEHVRITGLPFRIISPGNVNVGHAFNNYATTTYLYGQSNETQVWLYVGGSGYNTIVYSELTASSSNFLCLFTYFTDQ